jgi:hypothetical protein
MSNMDARIDRMIFRRRILIFLAMLPLALGGLNVLRNTYLKLGPDKVEVELRAWSRFKYWEANADIKCGPGVSQWHYVCTVARRSGEPPTKKIGVRVDATHITKVSHPHDISARYILSSC